MDLYLNPFVRILASIGNCIVRRKRRSLVGFEVLECGQGRDMIKGGNTSNITSRIGKYRWIGDTEERMVRKDGRTKTDQGYLVVLVKS